MTENQFRRITTETWYGGKLIRTEQTPWILEPRSVKVKISGDPNLITRSVKCPCCGISPDVSTITTLHSDALGGKNILD